jgi:hypothetical protein
MEKKKRNKYLIRLGIFIGVLGAIIGAFLIGKSEKAKEIAKIIKDAYGEGYNDGVNAPESKYSISKTNAARHGIKEGINIGRRSTLDGLSSPDLSNPDQIKLAVENGILLNKVGKEVAIETVKNAIPEKEFENYLKSKVEDSYDDTFLKP